MQAHQLVRTTMIQSFRAHPSASDVPVSATGVPASGDDIAADFEEWDVPLPSVGDILDGCYRLLRLLGEGMFGRVYEAERTDVPEHRVALKVMRRTMYAGRNVERELAVLAAAAHPNIVQLMDHGVTETLVWLTMPLYQGETLLSRLERSTLSLREAYDIFVPIARGLEALHQCGLRHQDVKPDNIFLARFGEQLHPILLDLGVAVEKSSSFVAGTALYGSPEQVGALGGLGSSAPLSEKVDSYCLGTTLLRMLAGLEYFPGEEAKTPLEVADSFDERETQPLREGALPELSGEPRELLNAALASWMRKDPTERPSAGQIADELDVLLESEREAARKAEQLVVRQKTSLQRVRAALVAAVLLGGVAALLLYSKRETLRMAGELQRARAQGEASFDQLDTCVAAHRLSQQNERVCSTEREEDKRKHTQALAALNKDNEQAVADVTRRLEQTQGALKSSLDDAKAAREDHEEQRRNWSNATATQKAKHEAERQDWQQREANKDEALQSCRTAKEQSEGAASACKQQLSSTAQSSEQCSTDLTSAKSAQRSCQSKLDSCAPSLSNCRQQLKICRAPLPPPGQ